MKYTGDDEDLASGMAYTSDWKTEKLKNMQLFHNLDLSAFHGHCIPHVLLPAGVEISELKFERHSSSL